MQETDGERRRGCLMNANIGVPPNRSGSLRRKKSRLSEQLRGKYAPAPQGDSSSFQRRPIELARLLYLLLRQQELAPLRHVLAQRRQVAAQMLDRPLRV